MTSNLSFVPPPPPTTAGAAAAPRAAPTDKGKDVKEASLSFYV